MCATMNKRYFHTTHKITISYFTKNNQFYYNFNIMQLLSIHISKQILIFAVDILSYLLI